ncbi:hypothetical protein BN1002_03927 [Bacillus sp. B-jedd]|nr:hypothetical protein BN1002_03927 [Bacillus sp. B-jedd]
MPSAVSFAKQKPLHGGEAAFSLFGWYRCWSSFSVGGVFINNCFVDFLQAFTVLLHLYRLPGDIDTNVSSGAVVIPLGYSVFISDAFYETIKVAFMARADAAAAIAWY